MNHPNHTPVEGDSLSSLIERLENAEGPSIVLDAEIYCVIHDNCERDGGAVILRCAETGHKKTKFAPPKYTSILDAALMLIPWEKSPLWGIDNDVPGGLDHKKQWHTAWCYGEDAQHEYPAIALCIASLKARARSTGESGE